MAIESSRSDVLRRGLASTCESAHWRCGDAFLQVCRLTQEQLETNIKKWWGNAELWLDMLATEIAKGVGRQVGLYEELGNSWVAEVDAWIDEAYAAATEGMSCPPQKAMMYAKAAPLVSEILGVLEVHRPLSGGSSFGHRRIQAEIKSMRGQARPKQETCTQCFKGYSSSLSQCPACQPSIQPQPVKVTAQPAKKEFDITVWQKLPPATIEPSVPWRKATDMMWCHGGSGGAFVLRLPTGAICIKGSACSPTDLFGHLLSMTLGIRTAGSRVVCPAHEENEAIRDALRKAEPAVEEHGLQLVRLGKMPMLTVMEFVDGIQMMGMQAHEYLKTEDAKDALWKELGRLMTFDMLINNYDRLPLAWANEGNLGNVMLAASQGIVVGIDHCVQPITHSAGMKNYLDRVQQAAGESCSGTGCSFERVKVAIYNNTAIELDDSQLDSLRAGCFDCLTEIAHLEAHGEMQKKLDFVFAQVMDAFADMDRDAIRSTTEACCSLVRDVARVVQNVLQVSDAVVKADK